MMNNNNLPKKIGFLDRLKMLFSGRTYEDIYGQQEAELANQRKLIENEWSKFHENNKKEGAKLGEAWKRYHKKDEEQQRREAALQEREKALQEREKALQDREANANKIRALYIKENRIPPNEPKQQVDATKCMLNRFEKLSEEFLQVAIKVEELKEKKTKMTPEEKKKVRVRFSNLKGKLLGEMAVLMEAMTPDQIQTTIIGDKSATVGIVAESLPSLLGVSVEEDENGIPTSYWIEDPGGNQKFKDIYDNEEAYARGVLESYFYGIVDLYFLGYLKGDIDKLSYLPRYDGAKVDFRVVSHILKEYFGVQPNLYYQNDMFTKLCKKESYSFIEGFTKPQGTMNISVSNNKPIGNIMELVGNLTDALKEEDERY